MKRLTGLPYCILHMLLLFASISLQHCYAVDTISAAQPLQDPNFIVSSGGTYKLGFFSPDDNTTSRYVGIMYNNAPKTSALWVANRDSPLSDSSGAVTISEDGNVVVMDGKKKILWSSNSTNTAPNSTATLINNGSFVLRDSSDGRIVWESFQDPTDTFWPGMRIGGSGNGTMQLTSWRSPSDPSTGDFTFGLNPLRYPEMFVWNRGVLLWRTGPWTGNVFIGIPEYSPVYGSRTKMLTDDPGFTYFTYDDVNNTDLLHYRISYNGSFQEYHLDGSGSWELTFQSIKTDCDLYGKCGPNGICDPKGSPICSCLQGFEPREKEEWTRGNWTAGCSRKALLQCDRNNSAVQQGEGDGYLKRTMLKIPDFSDIISTPEEECSNDCLKNCSCSAYTFVVGIGCLHWAHDSLIDIQQFSMRGADLYIRVAHSELDSAGSNKKRTAIIASLVTVGCLFFVVLFFFLWKFRAMHREKSRRMQEGELSSIQTGEEGQKSKLEELPLYSYETMANATDDFHIKNMLGRGGFGPVYKGKLLSGQEIAVKRLSNSSTQGMKEFMNEVTLISKLQHRNLVGLIGCCVEREEKMLVYEYLPNKSLDAYIFDSETQDFLDWNRRCIIIEGIGRGLLYLHRDSRLRIIHRDLKASNILLDEELNPKISDFGLARIFRGKQDQADTNRVVGTYGYMAPEYAMGGNFSEKSDVYSFGVLLLEIVSGKKNSSFYHGEENLSLLEYAWKLWNENEAVNFSFTEKHDPCSEVETSRCVQIGLLCVQDSPNDRPNMSNVLLMLNSEIVDIPRPKLPSYATTFPLPDGHFYSQSGTSNSNVSRTEVIGR